MKDHDMTVELTSVKSTLTDPPMTPLEGLQRSASGSFLNAGEEDESKFPKGAKLFVIMLALCLGTFIMALDTTIIATAVPKITAQFNSLEDVGWYGSSYLLTLTAFQPIFGKVFKHFDLKWSYICQVVIFEIGSLICAAAGSSEAFIVGRAVAGIGAAGLLQGALSIIGDSVPLRKKPVYIALVTSTFGFASCFGPVVGGALADKVSWRWCFWINLPVGALTIAAIVILLGKPVRGVVPMSLKEKLGQMDYVGAVLVIAATTCVLLAVQWGGTSYSWASARIIGLLVSGALLGVAFCAVQWRLGEKATIPSRVFFQRTVFGGAMYSFLIMAAVYAHTFYLPFYFQAVQGTSALTSGICSVPYITSNVVFSIIAAILVTTIGQYVPFMILGSIVMVIGSGLLHTIDADAGPGEWIGYQILCGAGLGLGLQIPLTAVQVVLNKEDTFTGNAILMFFQQFGSAISIAICQSLFTNTLVQEVPKYSPSIDPYMVLHIGATNLVKNITSPEDLHGVRLAYTKAIDRVFILPIVMAVLSLLACARVEWRSVKGRKIVPE